MIVVQTKVDGSDVVSSGSLVLSDDYRCSIIIGDSEIDIRFFIKDDEDASAKFENVNDNKVRLNFTNFGRNGTTTTAEVERIVTIEGVDLNLSLAIQTVKGTLVSRIIHFTIWKAV